MAEEKELMNEKVDHAAQHGRDSNSRMIFRNNVLMSQFLNNYTELPVFANVKPEDIEDITAKYHAFLGIEFETDTIKRVRLTTEDKEVYVISLVDHKSAVDYDVSMQLFRYMAVVWYDYARQCGEKHHNKNFRYPMIIPFVYYEGNQKWTAKLNFKERIEHISGLEMYVPKFEYKVVSINGYTDKELQEKEDEMSLIIQINKVQTPEDFHQFLKIPKKYMESILGNTTKDIRKIMSDVLWTLLMRMNIPIKEAQEAVESMEEGRMGELFANIEKMDLQAERENTRRERLRAENAEKRANTEKNRADAEKNRADAEKDRADAEKDRADAASALLRMMLTNTIKEEKAKNHTKEETIQLLKTKYPQMKQVAEWVEEIW